MLVRDPEHLRQAIHSLFERKRSGQLPGAGLEALAEACFRLALHPATQPEEAIELLERAVRADGANPKFAYHLGRIYLSCGALNRAGEWLQVASRLAPSSHRVWAHVSLLQRELNLRYKEDDRDNRYEQDALRERSQALAAQIRQGADQVAPILLDLTPPLSLAHLEKRARASGKADITREAMGPAAPPGREAGRPRLIAPARSRWSGIGDLLAEAMLEAVPTRPLQAELLPLLEETLAAAGRRRGGSAAFTQLALEWMLRGYPVASVRRLMEGRAPNSAGAAAWELLTASCEIFEEPDAANVPVRIAQALETGSIPPFLGALIHQRRVLWHKLRFGSLGAAYRAASRFVAEARRLEPESARRAALGPEAAVHLERLRAVVPELASKPPPELRDGAPDAVGAVDIAEAASILAALEAWAVQLESLWGRALAFLRDDLMPRSTRPGDPEARSLRAADAKGLRLFLERLDAASRQSLERRTAVRDAMAHDARGRHEEGVEKRLEDLKRKLDATLSRGPFGRYLKTVERDLVGEDRGVAPRAAGQTIEELLAEVSRTPGEVGGSQWKGAAAERPDGVDPARETGAPHEPGREPVELVDPASPVPADPLSSVAGMLRGIDRQIDELFERASGSFGPYPAEVMALPAFQALDLSVRSRHAEARFKLGQVTRAKRLWVEIARAAPFHGGVLKNVALCDVVSGELAGQQSSWRAHLETLYLVDLADGTPQPGAKERADFHRAFAGALLPASFLAERPRSEPGDVPSLLKFLASRGRLRQFVNHTLLQALNARLGFTSPLLILGVDRNAGPETLARAQQGMLQFMRHVVPLLPERIREPFGVLARSRIDRAFAATGSARRLTEDKDRSFSEEKDSLLGWLKQVVELKFRIFSNIQPHLDDLLSLGQLDWLVELRRLDRIPIDASDGFLANTAASYGDPALFPELILSQLGLRALSVLSERGEISRAYEFLIAEVEGAVRRADILQATLGAAADLAQQRRDRSGHARLFGAVTGWLERMRAGSDLEETELAGIRRALHHTMAGIFAAPFGGLQAGAEHAGALVTAMTELAGAYPEVEPAYYHRVFGRVELANQAQAAAAQHEEEPADAALTQTKEAISQLGLAREDARWLIDRGSDAELSARARELDEQLAARLGGLRVNELALELRAVGASSRGGVRDRAQLRELARRFDALHQKARALRAEGVEDQAGEALDGILHTIDAQQEQLAELERSLRR